MAEQPEGSEDMPSLELADEEDLLTEEAASTSDNAAEGIEEAEVKVEAGASDPKPPTPVNTGWVDILEKENDLKLMSELNKIGKLRSRNDKTKDMNAHGYRTTLKLFPVYPEDLVDPYLLGVINKCRSSNVQFHVIKEGEDQQIKGQLELKFATYSDCAEEKEKLSQLRDDITILQFQGPCEQYSEFMNKWRALAGLPQDKMEHLTLYAPSLPETVTQEELWELFPLAREVALIPDQPRQHAYLKFSTEEIMQKSIQDLKQRGPPRADFNFCRLVRYSRIAAINRAAQTKDKPAVALSTATSPARPTTSVDGQRKKRRRGKRGNNGEQKQASPAQAETKPKAAATAVAPAAKAKAKQQKAGNDASTTKAGTAAKNGQTQKAAAKKKQGNQQQRSQQQFARPNARSGNTWYSERRAMHLQRARNPVRASEQNSTMLNTTAGIQMLGNLLSSLGQLSSGTQLPSNGQQSSGQRQGFSNRGNQRLRGDPQGRGWNRAPSNYVQGSPTKRSHSMEEMDLSGSVQPQTSKSKRRRIRNRTKSTNKSFDDSFAQESSYRSESRPNSSYGYRSMEYETPRRTSVSGSYSTPDYGQTAYSQTDYGRPSYGQMDYGRASYDSYSRPQSTSTPMDKISMLDTLTRLAGTKQSTGSRSLPSTSNPLQTSADYYGAGSSYYR